MKGEQKAWITFHLNLNGTAFITFQDWQREDTVNVMECELHLVMLSEPTPRTCFEPLAYLLYKYLVVYIYSKIGLCQVTSGITKYMYLAGLTRTKPNLYNRLIIVHV